MAVEQLGVLGGGRLVVSVDETKKEILLGVNSLYKGAYGDVGSISSWDADDFAMGDKPYEQNAAKYIQRAYGRLKNSQAPIRIVNA